MRRKAAALVACLLASALTTPPAVAQEGDGGKPTLEERMEALETRNRELEDEVDELRAAARDDWLTEARADEIRTLVADVLADSDTRSSLQSSGLTAGWSENFFLASPDGRFKLQIDGMLQSRFIWNHFDTPDRNRWGFENTRARLTFRGHVFSKDIQYLIRTEQTRKEQGIITGLFFIQDFWIRMNLNNETSFRVGQFKLPFMREQLVDSGKQLAVERSLVNENLSIERSEGIEFTIARETTKFDFALVDAPVDQIGDGGTSIVPPLGLVGVRPKYSPWSAVDSEYTLVARNEWLLAGEWRQFEDFTSPPDDPYGAMFGLAAFYFKDERTGVQGLVRDEEEWLGVTADLSLEWGGANLFMSWVWHYLESRAPRANINFHGAVVQGGVYLTPKFEVFGRMEYGFWDTDSADFHDLWVITVGGNYYLDGHDLKWSTDFGFGINAVDRNWDSSIAGWRPDNPESEPQVVIRTQFQLLF